MGLCDPDQTRQVQSQFRLQTSMGSKKIQAVYIEVWQIRLALYGQSYSDLFWIKSFIKSLSVEAEYVTLRISPLSNVTGFRYAQQIIENSYF